MVTDRAGMFLMVAAGRDPAAGKKGGKDTTMQPMYVLGLAVYSAQKPSVSYGFEGVTLNIDVRTTTHARFVLSPSQQSPRESFPSLLFY